MDKLHQENKIPTAQQPQDPACAFPGHSLPAGKKNKGRQVSDKAAAEGRCWSLMCLCWDSCHPNRHCGMRQATLLQIRQKGRSRKVVTNKDTEPGRAAFLMAQAGLPSHSPPTPPTTPLALLQPPTAPCLGVRALRNLGGLRAQ